jgi:phenylacetate-coenzyme A ligase PaaK-like adenylate-forming protein
MIVEVEIKPELFSGDVQKIARLKERIQSELHSEILVTPQVVLVEPGSNHFRGKSSKSD